MMYLAQEIPTSMLEIWAPLSDFDFLLAHKVLEDRYYAEFFARRPEGREVLLDNSLHELGYPLPLSDLLEAAKRCKATCVITPDRVGDVEFNAQQFHAAQSALSGFRLAVVMTGSTDGSSAEREKFLFDVREAQMLCLTFKEPKRLAWYRESAAAKKWYRVHLLGVDEFSELDEFATIARNDVRSWSVDTAKALKRAMEGLKLDELASLRGSASHERLSANVQSHKLLDWKREDISAEQDELFRYNVKVLRSHLK